MTQSVTATQRVLIIDHAIGIQKIDLFTVGSDGLIRTAWERAPFFVE